MSDEKTRDEDEDLMSDFKDLFPEDEDSDPAAAGTPEGSQDAGEALDELDAFLDDFEKGFNPDGDESTLADDEPPTAAASEEAPVLTDEVSDAELNAASDERSALGLDREELDLAVGEPEEAEEAGEDLYVEPAGSAVADENPVEDENGTRAESEPDSGPAGPDPLDEVAALATAAPAAAAASSVAPAQGMSRTLQWSVISVMLVSLGLSATAAWMAFSTASELDRLSHATANMSPQQAPSGVSTAAINALHTELRTLRARVNELAVVIEGPMSHLSESNEGTLADIEKRLARLEQGAGQAEARPRPLVEKKPVSKVEPVAAAATPKKATGGGWAINLISLTSEQDADKELKHLLNLGVRAEKQRAVKDGKVWYRLRVPGFASYEGAKAYIDTVEKKTGVKNAWVAKE